MVQKGKDSFYENLSDKLKSHKLCSKDLWSTIKHFIDSNSTSNIPPLEYNNNVVSEDLAKANVLNTFFQSQTILNENGVILPDIQPVQVDTELDKLVLTQQEVQSALEIIPLGKASGPNGQVTVYCVSCLLKFLLPIAHSSTSRCDLVCSQLHIKKRTCAMFLRKGSISSY